MAELEDGDVIRIGESEVRFELEPDAGDQQPQKTVFLQTVINSAGKEIAPAPPSRSKELLEAAYTLMNALASNFDCCDLVNRILSTTLEATHGQRGAVLFAGDEGELLPCDACGHVHMIENGTLRSAEIDEIQISETVARRVLETGETVLFQSARADNPIEASHSMHALSLTSILCVPIRTQDRILGILYIDTDVSDHRYTEEDLLLAAAAGNSAGVALENARIHQALLESQRMEQDIAAAWTIQQGFLVREWPEDDPRLEVYGETRPAKVVGGDFYDFVRLGSDSVGLVIGDVSGKGVPAAITMAQLVAEIRLLSAQEAGSPAEVVRRLNQLLAARSRHGAFCSLALITVDLPTGRLVEVNAGHHPPLRASEGRATSLEGASGPPLGVFPDTVWTESVDELRPGDGVFLYTDGIVEARSAGEQGPSTDEYGSPRLHETAAASGGSTPQALVESVMEDVSAFCAPGVPHDDCTMIGLRYRGHRR